MSITQRRRSSVIRTAITINSTLIKSQMNLVKVAQAISEEEGLLTIDQENLLWQRFTPEEERKSQLLEFICQKGEEGMKQFVRCLRASGHNDLANSLDSQINGIPAE